MNFHVLTLELIACHELFRRLGFLPTELGPVVVVHGKRGQVVFRATLAIPGRQIWTFNLQLAGPFDDPPLAVEVAERVRDEYARAAEWWNGALTPDSDRRALYTNSLVAAMKDTVVVDLALKGCPFSYLNERKETL